MNFADPLVSSAVDRSNDYWQAQVAPTIRAENAGDPGLNRDYPADIQAISAAQPKELWETDPAKLRHGVVYVDQQEGDSAPVGEDGVVFVDGSDAGDEPPHIIDPEGNTVQ